MHIDFCIVLYDAAWLQIAKPFWFKCYVLFHIITLINVVQMSTCDELPVVPNIVRHRKVESILREELLVRIPTGLQQVIENFVREILQVQPRNIDAFGYWYFKSLLKKRKEGIVLISFKDFIMFRMTCL